MEYDAIVIGAGIGGMCAAFNLSLEGKKVLVLEAQAVIGGYATTFTRKGFTFESSLHCVGALGASGQMREYFEATGLAKELEFIEPKECCRMIYPEHDFSLDYSGAGRTQNLVRLFPSEQKNIEKFFKSVKRFSREFDLFSQAWLPEACMHMAVPLFFRSILWASRHTARECVGRYIKDKKLVGLLTDFWSFTGSPPEKLSALYFLLMFDSYCYGGVAQIKGGFSRVLEIMAKRIEEAGGKVQLNSSVVGIRTQPGACVTGVTTARQEEFNAKVVISNVNPFDTLCKYIDDQYLRQEYHKRLGALEKTISAFQIYLGLKVPAARLGMTHPMLSINPGYDHQAQYAAILQRDFQNCPFILTDHSLLDPSLVPAGKGSLLIIVFDTYARWKALDKDTYLAKKQQEASRLISRAEQYLPGLSESIEVMEIATPLTMERYTGSVEGALYGFTQSIGQAGDKRLAQTTDIKGLILAGAWTQPGAGAYGCFASGMIASELAVKYLKKHQYNKY